MPDPSQFAGRQKFCWYGDKHIHASRAVGINNRETACGRWVSDKALHKPRSTEITCPPCAEAVAGPATQPA